MGILTRYILYSTPWSVVYISVCEQLAQSVLYCVIKRKSNRGIVAFDVNRLNHQRF